MKKIIAWLVLAAIAALPGLLVLPSLGWIVVLGMYASAFFLLVVMTVCIGVLTE